MTEIQLYLTTVKFSHRMACDIPDDEMLLLGARGMPANIRLF